MTMAAYVQIRNDVHPDDVAQLDGHRHTIGAIKENVRHEVNVIVNDVVVAQVVIIGIPCDGSCSQGKGHSRSCQQVDVGVFDGEDLALIAERERTDK